mgnify:CR=1 FL=1
MAEKWIQKAIKHKGALRKQLKVKEGKTIPISKINKKLKTLDKKKKLKASEKTLKRRLTLAKTLKKLR